MLASANTLGATYRYVTVKEPAFSQSGADTSYYTQPTAVSGSYLYTQPTGSTSYYTTQTSTNYMAAYMGYQQPYSGNYTAQFLQQPKQQQQQQQQQQHQQLLCYANRLSTGALSTADGFHAAAAGGLLSTSAGGFNESTSAVHPVDRGKEHFDFKSIISSNNNGSGQHVLLTSKLCYLTACFPFSRKG